MSKSMISAAGGLSAEDRAKLIPDNVREGVTLFEGTAKEVVGSFLGPQYYMLMTTANAENMHWTVCLAQSKEVQEIAYGPYTWTPTPTVKLPVGTYQVVCKLVGSTPYRPVQVSLTGADVEDITIIDGHRVKITVFESCTVSVPLPCLVYPTNSGRFAAFIAFYEIEGE